MRLRMTLWRCELRMHAASSERSLKHTPMKNGCITLAVIGVVDLDDLLIEPKRPISAGAEIYEKSISTGR